MTYFIFLNRFHGKAFFLPYRHADWIVGKKECLHGAIGALAKGRSQTDGPELFVPALRFTCPAGPEKPFRKA